MGMLHARRMFFCHLRRYSKIKFCCSRKSSYLCSHFMNARYFYKNAIAAFLRQNEDEIFGMLSMNDEYDTMATQKFAWLDEIRLIKSALLSLSTNFLPSVAMPFCPTRVRLLARWPTRRPRKNTSSSTPPSRSTPTSTKK